MVGMRAKLKMPFLLHGKRTSKSESDRFIANAINLMELAF